MASPHSTLPKSDEEQDSAYNPGEQAYREGMGSGHIASDIDQAGAFANDPNNHDSADAVRDDEEKGGWNDNTSSYGGNKSKSGQGISKANFKAILKKRGPLAAIITLLLGGSIGAGVFFGPALLLVQIQESLLSKFDSQNTSMTIRTNKILANKLVEQNTSGSCNIVKVACQFSRPSNKLLGNLEKNGVLAFDKAGNQISKTGLFQSDRPAKYTFNGKDISAKEFSSVLRDDGAFRAAFHKAYNPRFIGFSDAVFKKIKLRFGFDVSNKDAQSGDKTTKERLNESSKGINAVADETAGDSEGILKKLLSTRAGEVVGKIAKGGKGDAFGLIAASVCTIADVPKLVVSTVRAYQLVQVVNFSMQFLIAGSALKAGQITPEQATALGALLTTSIANKSAMDSFGMKYAMYGDTKAPSTSLYKKFIPGGSATDSLGGISKVLSSSEKKNVCDFATNPATGATLNVGLAAAGPETLGVSLGIAALNIATGFLVSEVVTSIGVPLIERAVSGIDVKPLLSFFLGDLTQNLAGESVGDALASGASNMMSQTANAGGNMPLTVNQAVAYNQSTQDVNIAYAQEDRATLSPLDPTNHNTMVGSIVGKLIPFFVGINSVSSALSSVASIPSKSIASLINTSTASALTAEQYSLCNDTSITDTGTAAGPFCNIEYGIPTEYLNMDPQEIVDSLTASGDINADSGEPIDKGDGESLYRWIDVCTNTSKSGGGDTDVLQQCQITDSKTAMYSIYTIDHRIQQSMDETDPTVSVESNDTNPQTVTSTVIETSTQNNLSTKSTNNLTPTIGLSHLLASSKPVSSLVTPKLFINFLPSKKYEGMIV